MEQFKTFDEITTVDEAHRALSSVTGFLISLPKLHAKLGSIELHEGVPEGVRGQFNVARNMALYYFFHYAMAPEVQMKTYAVIELALKQRFPESVGKSLAWLLKKAVNAGLLKDSGFRHLDDPSPANPYCKSLLVVLPTLRNESAHGSTFLTPDCVGHIEKCADLINQLFERDNFTDRLKPRNA
ncbi:MAG: hypothetical protein KXJ61_05510 [Hydrogenophaga sp.]|jgi:hypothetical protein|uniref:hypothetical protein n=1 Tax=Hydrogenophaga sp. TaxID=1904254 RepID=UPI001DBB4D05|nr:hypothetical protein [Hydrogenophaga sp.]MBW0169668.1 hypothetical protein [Hydrogenophaga sp.]MBW0183290.1 hypothetical protein [Hydrogenophaga sp.]